MEKREYGWLLPSRQRASVAMWIEPNGIPGWDELMQKRIVDRAQQEAALPDHRWLNAILDLSIIPDTTEKIAFASLVQLRIA